MSNTIPADVATIERAFPLLPPMPPLAARKFDSLGFLALNCPPPPPLPPNAVNCAVVTPAGTVQLNVPGVEKSCTLGNTLA